MRTLTDQLIISFIDPLIYDTLFSQLSDTLFEFLIGVWTALELPNRAGTYRKLSVEFLKRFASTLITAALRSRKKVHKIARQEIEGITHLKKTYIISAKDADSSEADILDSL